MFAELLDNIGRYEIVGELGAGSMSRVYLAHDPNLDRKLAVKVVLQGFSLDNREQSELERRFLLEARAAGKLSHPNIVRVFDADTDPDTGVPYIAMEWVQGRSLRSLLEETRRLSGPRTLDILAQVARALDYAHRFGRIHRDIKPSNILIATDGTAKVSDFGVAKIVSETHTVSGQVLGTPAFMSPEQVKDEPLDGRSDLFSLGAVLYQCIAGTPPFGGDGLVQVVYKILTVDPRPLKLPSSPAFDRLDAVVQRSLQRDPNARFQSGAEFAETLEELREMLESEPDNEFRAPPSADSSSPTTSDTIKIDVPLAPTPPMSRVQGNTQTVQMSPTEIQSAIGSDKGTAANHPMAADAVTKEVSLPVRSGIRYRLLGAAGLAILMVAALVSPAVYRYLQAPPGPIEVGVASTPTHQISAAFESRIEPTIDSGLQIPDQPAPWPEDRVERREITRRPQTQTSTPRASQSTQSPADLPVESTSAQVPETAIKTSPTSLEVADPHPTLTPVTIIYKHKGGLAFLTIKLDGVKVWSQELHPVTGRLQKISGYEARAVVPVSAGTHTLDVHLVDPDRNLDATGSIRSRYTNGRKRALKVNLDVSDNEMVLRWKE